MSLTPQLPPQLQQIAGQLIYQATETLQESLQEAERHIASLQVQLSQYQEKAHKYETEVEPLKLLDSSKNQLTIRYRSLQEQEMLDRLRVRLNTFNPPRFPLAMRAWFLWRTQGPLSGYHKPPDPAYLFLSRLLEIYDEHPELIAEIINSPVYSAHLKDMSPLEVTARVATEES